MTLYCYYPRNTRVIQGIEMLGMQSSTPRDTRIFDKMYIINIITVTYSCIKSVDTRYGNTIYSTGCHCARFQQVMGPGPSEETSFDLISSSPRYLILSAKHGRSDIMAVTNGPERRDQRRISQRLCYQCRRRGHYAKNCTQIPDIIRTEEIIPFSEKSTLVYHIDSLGATISAVHAN